MILQEMYANKKVHIDNMDCILVDYDLFFDEQLGKYNCFSIDEEDELEKIKEVCYKLMQLGAKTYIFAYSEDENSLGEKYIYADCLWIDTRLTVKDLSGFFVKKYKSIEPSDISLIKDTGYNQNDLFLFKLTGKVVKFKEIINETTMEDIKSLYWD